MRRARNLLPRRRVPRRLRGLLHGGSIGHQSLPVAPPLLTGPGDLQDHPDRLPEPDRLPGIPSADARRGNRDVGLRRWGLLVSGSCLRDPLTLLETGRVARYGVDGARTRAHVGTGRCAKMGHPLQPGWKPHRKGHVRPEGALHRDPRALFGIEHGEERIGPEPLAVGIRAAASRGNADRLAAGPGFARLRERTL